MSDAFSPYYAAGIICLSLQAVLYTANDSRGKTFTVVHKTLYSLENFCGVDHQGHHVPYTTIDSRGNFLNWLTKCENCKVFPLETLICRVQYMLVSFSLNLSLCMCITHCIIYFFCQSFVHTAPSCGYNTVILQIIVVGDEDGNINIYQLKKMNATPEDQVGYNIYNINGTLKGSRT